MYENTSFLCICVCAYYMYTHRRCSVLIFNLWSPLVPTPSSQEHTKPRTLHAKEQYAKYDAS